MGNIIKDLKEATESVEEMKNNIMELFDLHRKCLAVIDKLFEKITDMEKGN